MCVKTNTRQRILDEAFRLCEEEKNSTFSLSKLATRVGISKTAIFRHFKNKDALLLEMENLLLNDIAVVLSGRRYFFMEEPCRECTEEEFADIVEKAIKLFLEKQGYMDFFLQSHMCATSTGTFLIDELYKRGVKFSKSYVTQRTPRRFFRMYYCVQGIVFFIMRYRCLRETDVTIPSERDFIDKITNLLWNGIRNGKIQLDKKKKKQLDEICIVSEEVPSENSRFLKVFAEVFAENGIDGITVEKITEKLNLSKSSLYAFFNNKEDFIMKMLSEEIMNIMKALIENAKHADTVDELIYILLRTEKNYLEIRPFVIMIHLWAVQKGFKFEKKYSDEHSQGTEELFKVFKKDIRSDVGMDARALVGWASSLIGAMRIYFEVSRLKEITAAFDYVDELFNLIECGIGNNTRSV